MLPEIKRILYTTDLSKNARYAFGYAASLANRYSAGITILHVLEEFSPHADSLVINMIGSEKWKEIRSQNEEKVLLNIKERLEEFCAEVGTQLPACPFITDAVVVRIGNPVEEILKLAEAGDFDMLVMGAHGHGIIGESLMGSVSRRVLRRCRKPVLVIRLPE